MILKLVSTMETNALGSQPSKLSSICPTWNNCFSQIAEGSISREQGAGGLWGLQCVKGYSYITHDPLKLRGA